MKLNQIVLDAVDLAFSVAEDAIANVSWTFANGSAGDYDPLTETRTGSSVTRDIDIIPYVDKRDDSSHNFSSTGQFNDPPVEQDEFEIMMKAVDADPQEPSVNDTFLWPNKDRTSWVKFSVSSIERYPIKSIFVIKCRRS